MLTITHALILRRAVSHLHAPGRLGRYHNGPRRLSLHSSCIQRVHLAPSSDHVLQAVSASRDTQQHGLCRAGTPADGHEVLQSAYLQMHRQRKPGSRRKLWIREGHDHFTA